MFTGIVSDVGVVAAREARNDVVRFAIASRYAPASIELGASIACAGVCLTVVAVDTGPRGAVFSVEAAPETLEVTRAGTWDVGTRLNLERALKLTDELGGHLVTGHVDGLAELYDREDLGETTRLSFSVAPELARFVAQKGSVALDGTSLTVNSVAGNRFSVLLIPHTLQVTTWDDVRVGHEAHIEVDMMARYAARLAETRSLG